MMFSRGLFHMSYLTHGLGEFGLIAMAFWGLLLIAALVVGIVLIARRNKMMAVHHNDAAIDALNRRFAAGEMTEEEYLKRKEVLRRM